MEIYPLHNLICTQEESVIGIDMIQNISVGQAYKKCQYIAEYPLCSTRVDIWNIYEVMFHCKRVCYNDCKFICELFTNARAKPGGLGGRDGSKMGGCYSAYC